jgi:hypothetical protein
MDEESKQLVPEKAKALMVKLDAAIRHIHDRLPKI